ncbi:MAG: bifunctional folylpolyglutamate synthase/dihydrofolate synthase [Vampirovibrio sp.]|nr:bifunctional folylpolyglutamate synthase/dihydrofolate synthase [Vampirovibrio sp.]
MSTVPSQFNQSTAKALLNQLTMSTIKLGTQRMLSLCELLGHPQNQRPVIHVAGTNGKGSVCTMLTYGLMAQGLKVGTTVSPHLCDVSERILINAQPLSPFDFNLAVTQLWKRLTQHLGEFEENSEEWPTYFEFLVLLAFKVFVQADVDVVVLETGLGGRLDATNVVDSPVATVITSIGFDHTEHLGNTLESIAKEKAGIFRTDVPVIIGPNIPDDAFETLQQQATALRTGAVIETTSALLQRTCPLTEAGTQSFKNMVSTELIELGLLGNYQKHNLATVLATANILQRQGLVTNIEAFYRGLKNAQWAGRFQYFKPHQLLVDGSHNEDGLNALTPSLHDTFGEKRPLFWLLSLRKNRPIDLIVQLLKRHGRETMGVVVTQASQAEKNADLYHCPYKLRQQLRNALPALKTRPIWAASTPEVGLRVVQQWVNNHPKTDPLTAEVYQSSALGVVTGSLYTAGDVLSLLRNEG